MRVGSGVALLALAAGVGAAGCGGSGSRSSAVAMATPEDVPPTPDGTPAPADNGGPQRAPIVLMHGMAGFESIGPAEYFYGVAERLRDGGHEVFVTVVDPFQSVEVRAAQAKEQIDAYLAEHGGERVHLVGHSQGGLDARHLVSVLGYGEKVATVTTIATPHHGLKLVDVALGAFPGDSAAALAALSSAFLGVATGTDADLGTQLVELGATHAAATFNPNNPDDPRVRYYSVAGVTQPWLLVDHATTDVCDPLFLAAYWMNLALEGENDGLVPVSSSRWGEYWGALPADHLDEMGWFPGVPQPAFDHLAFYERLAAFLTGETSEPPLGAP